jgi:hypothetical protein
VLRDPNQAPPRETASLGTGGAGNLRNATPPGFAVGWFARVVFGETPGIPIRNPRPRETSFGSPLAWNLPSPVSWRTRASRAENAYGASVQKIICRTIHIGPRGSRKLVFSENQKARAGVGVSQKGKRTRPPEARFGFWTCFGRVSPDHACFSKRTRVSPLRTRDARDPHGASGSSGNHPRDTRERVFARVLSGADIHGSRTCARALGTARVFSRDPGSSGTRVAGNRRWCGCRAVRRAPRQNASVRAARSRR